MKKITLIGLMLISLQAKLHAQNYFEKQMSMSKTDQTFNNASLVNVKDFVVLREGRMIIELATWDDYKALENLDSMLTEFMKDIAFYKDSLSADPTAHYRIDYVLNDQYSFREIRFKKYSSDGNIFMNRDGEIAKLKFDEDTVRIILRKSMPGLSGNCTVNYNAQITFLVGNYYDIPKIIANKELPGIMETLEKESKPKKTSKFYELTHQTTIIYNPYYSVAGKDSKGMLTKHDFIMKNEYSLGHGDKHKISFNPQIGAGLVRNTLSPVGDIGIQYNKYWNNYRECNIFRLSGTGYFFFDKDAKGNFLLSDNWFINATMGNISNETVPTWFGKQTDFGLGYLVSQKGGYFKNNTFRVFTDIMYIRGITIVPEIIFTNNFKQIFPGITVKVL